MDDCRKYRRLRLRCPVALWDPREGSVISTTTENLSSDGFYCVCSNPLIPGDELQATLKVPCKYWNGHGADYLVLQCDVEVVRTVLNSAQDSFGVALRIKQYVSFAIRPASVDCSGT